MAAPGHATLLRTAAFDRGRLTFQLGNGLGAIVDGNGAVVEFCRRERLSAAVTNRIEVIFEEVVANIIRHGFEAGSAQSIRISLAIADSDVVLVFDDDGMAFDPTQRAAPAPLTSLAEAPIGGLGIPLVRRLARTVDYSQPAPGIADSGVVNRLTVRVDAGVRIAAGL